MEALLYSFLAGISTSLGVIILILFGKPSEKVLSALLGFAGGIMLAISVFELMPEAVEFGSITAAVIGFVLGALMMYLLDKVVPHSHLSEPDDLVVENAENFKKQTSPMLRMGYLILFGIALHNLPEGLAIGAGLESSPEVGLFIAIAIALHNIPEGLAMAGPLKAGGLGSGKIFLFTLIAGLMTPVGAAIGLIFFSISPVFVGGSLAFAAGAMIYIVNDELIPQANAMHSHLANTGIIVGLLLGFVFL
ncbi:ZIP family zinc transporter [Natranaerovirga hydrolytica]|uniref:ZIP family zinc transporter n=1 Tax=Natranaerovirga hydrolytica TaxID=680378 RepID=A0A4R1MJU2_9FIRM|nr:ZIP family metal transporter [Natranaerovirga hydrolytica]TCK90589.1 ZIP family zinc transporter [Natranaerovirga hydrolytica]